MEVTLIALFKSRLTFYTGQSVISSELGFIRILFVAAGYGDTTEMH